MFDIIIWSGAVMSLFGLAGIVYCILRVQKARRAQVSDEALRETLQAVLPLNLGAMFLSIIGLMLVTIGVILG